MPGWTILSKLLRNPHEGVQKDKNEAAKKMIARLRQVAEEREHVAKGADLDHITTKPRAVRRYPRMTGKYGY